MVFDKKVIITVLGCLAICLVVYLEIYIKVSELIFVVQEIFFVEVHHQIPSFSQFMTKFVRANLIIRPERGRYYVPSEIFDQIEIKVNQLNLDGRKPSIIDLQVINTFRVPDDISLQDFSRDPLKYLTQEKKIWDLGHSSPHSSQADRFHETFSAETARLEQQIQEYEEKVSRLSEINSTLLEIFQKATDLNESPTTGLIEVAKSRNLSAKQLLHQIEQAGEA